MISIKGLTVKYPAPGGSITALDGINLDIDAGSTLAVLGPSGCGKTTLLHVMAGIIREYQGRVLLDSRQVNPREHRIGLVMQDYGLLPWKTVLDNALLGLKVKKGSLSREETDYGETILERLGLKELVSRYPSRLSGGQRQRVAIARSFILKPDLLLMDEPFSALDEMTREDMQDLFLQVWAEHRVSTILVTHSVQEAVCLGKKIALLTSAPGRVKKIVANPLFGAGNLRSKNQFYSFTLELRETLKEGWSA